MHTQATQTHTSYKLYTSHHKPHTPPPHTVTALGRVSTYSGHGMEDAGVADIRPGIRQMDAPSRLQPQNLDLLDESRCS
jgi:hypothetical protein